jgi:hypothetical protein
MNDRIAIVTEAGEWRILEDGRVIARLDTFDPFSPDAENLAKEIAGGPDRVTELEVRIKRMRFGGCRGCRELEAWHICGKQPDALGEKEK